MHKLLIFVFGLSLLLIVVGCSTQIDIPEQASFTPILTGSTQPGDVAIELIPQKITSDELVLSISMNTHSVELDAFNLLEMSTLHYNSKIVQPVDAPKLRGHHVSGELVFPLDQKVSQFSVSIENIPLVGKRIFSWEVK
jgi:hypothetical protein